MSMWELYAAMWEREKRRRVVLSTPYGDVAHYDGEETFECATELLAFLNHPKCPPPASDAKLRLRIGGAPVELALDFQDSTGILTRQEYEELERHWHANSERGGSR